MADSLSGDARRFLQVLFDRTNGQMYEFLERLDNAKTTTAVRVGVNHAVAPLPPEQGRAGNRHPLGPRGLRGARLVRLPGHLAEARAPRHPGGAGDALSGRGRLGTLLHHPPQSVPLGAEAGRGGRGPAPRTACGCWEGRVAISSDTSELPGRVSASGGRVLHPAPTDDLEAR